MSYTRRYLLAVAVCGAALLLPANTVQAQHRHGGWGRGGWSHGHGHLTRVGHYLHDHAGYGSYHHDYHQPVYSSYYYPNVYSGYYSTPVYVQPAPVYSVPVVSARMNEPVVIPARQEVAGNVAVVELTLPDAGARVWVEGVEMTSRGATRIFDSPALASGRIYTYTIRAAWNAGDQVVGDERRLDVSAGQTFAIDFTRPDRPIRERMPAPK